MARDTDTEFTAKYLGGACVRQARVIAEVGVRAVADAEIGEYLENTKTETPQSTRRDSYLRGYNAAREKVVRMLRTEAREHRTDGRVMMASVLDRMAVLMSNERG